MSEESKIAQAFGWQSINVVVQSLIQLLFKAVLARLIAPESFGIMAIVLIVTGFIDIFAQIGIGPAIIQRKNITDQQISGSFYLSFLLGFFFFGIMWFTAPLLSDYYHDQSLTDLFRVIALSFIISGIQIVPKSLLLKQLRFKEIFISVTLGMTVGLLIVGLGLAFLDYEVWSYAIALLAQSTIMTFCYWYFSPLKLQGLKSIAAAGALIRYGSGSTLFTFFNYISSKTDVFLVSDFGKTDGVNNWGNTGLYDQSLNVMNYPITIIGKLSDSVMFSGLSLIQDQKTKLKYAFKQAFSVLSLISLPASVFLMIFAEEVVLVLLGDQYLEAIPIVQILFAGLFLRTIIKLSDAVLKALDRVYTGALIKFVYFLCIAGLVWLTLYHDLFSIESLSILSSVAIALIISVLIQFVLMLSVSLNVLELNLNQLLNLLKGPMVIMLLMAVFGLITKLLICPLIDILIVRIILALLVFGGSYITVIWFAPQLFGRAEHNTLYPILKRIPKKGFLGQLVERVKEKTGN